MIQYIMILVWDRGMSVTHSPVRFMITYSDVHHYPLLR